MAPSNLPHEIYRFRLEAPDDMRLPEHKGSAFRGVFGRSGGGFVQQFVQHFGVST